MLVAATFRADAFFFFFGGSSSQNAYHADNVDNGTGTNVWLSGQFDGTFTGSIVGDVVLGDDTIDPFSTITIRPYNPTDPAFVPNTIEFRGGDALQSYHGGSLHIRAGHGSSFAGNLTIGGQTNRWGVMGGIDFLGKMNGDGSGLTNLTIDASLFDPAGAAAAAALAATNTTEILRKNSAFLSKFALTNQAVSTVTVTGPASSSLTVNTNGTLNLSLTVSNQNTIFYTNVTAAFFVVSNSSALTTCLELPLPVGMWLISYQLLGSCYTNVGTCGSQSSTSFSGTATVLWGNVFRNTGNYNIGSSFNGGTQYMAIANSPFFAAAAAAANQYNGIQTIGSGLLNVTVAGNIQFKLAQYPGTVTATNSVWLHAKSFIMATKL